MNRPPSLLLAALALAGCALPGRPPPEVAHLQLERADSPTVMVSKIWLARENGALVAKGYVLKRPDATDTTRTRLDVTLSDETGRVLRRTVEHFEPRQIPHRYRAPDYASFRVPLDPLPAGTTRIAVRAHDGADSS